MKVCYVAVLDRVVKYFFGPEIDAICENNDVTCITNFTDPEFREKLSGKVKTADIKISRNVSPFNLIKSIFKLRKIFKKEKFDVIQYTGPSTGLICSIAGRMAKVKTRVYCLWGVRYEGFSGGLKRKIFKFLEKQSCKNSTNIIFDSEYNRDFLIKEKVLKDDKKTYVVSKGSACGIDLKTYDIAKKDAFNEEVRTKYNVPKEAFVVGYLGRISYEKGVNEILYSMKQIMSEDKNVYLMMVGFVEEEAGMDKELLEWAQAEQRVIFTGRQDQPERFYASFDLFVFPSYREGFGGGVVQAGAFAVPSIVSDIGPLVETIRHGELGWSFPVKDRQALLETIQAVYKDTDALKEKGENMQKYVQQYFEQAYWMEIYKKHITDVYEANKNKK